VQVGCTINYDRKCLWKKWKKFDQKVNGGHRRGKSLAFLSALCDQLRASASKLFNGKRRWQIPVLN
jgi:hypothetical protein